MIKFARYHLLFASNSFPITDSMYLGTIQIYRNSNEHYYYLNPTTSVIRQIDTNCYPFQSLNMLPFYIRIRTLKTNLLGLVSNFPKYYFKTGTICLLFLSPHVFTALKCDSNHFDILKIVKPRDHNEIKPPIGKIIRKYKPIRHYFVMSRCKQSLQQL